MADIAQETNTAPQVGDKMPDGMKYGGVSPDTGKPFYVDAADAPGTYTFGEAGDYAARQGKRVPTASELNVMFNRRAAIGGFKTTGHPLFSRFLTIFRYAESYMT